MSVAALVEGLKVRYLPQPEWGVGHLVSLQEEGARAQVLFPTRGEEPVLVSTKGGALVPHRFLPGDAARTAKGQLLTVVGEEPGARGLRRYVVRDAKTGEEDELPESELRALAPRSDLLSTLCEGRVGDARAFSLRKQALVLDDERRCDALGALLASRVMVKPHQVGVVQRVLSARRPRFVLADEVGLGKTIEAGMVFSALRLSGLARRVLVVAPSHLTVQWLAELFHKFNQLFTLLDSERYQQSLDEAPGVSPWARFPLVVTSLELLSRGDEHREQAGSESAFWDLVIIDEAHHLKGEKAFAAAQALAKNSWGLLLLTATPMQLDPAEYHGLLTLIDPSSAPSVKGFEERLARQEELSAAVRALLEGQANASAVGALARRFPQDARLQALASGRGDAERAQLLEHLAETYSLSDRLVRNRRAVVGGFSTRRLHRHPVSPTPEELQVRDRALQLLSESSLRGAPLASTLRRLESSPAAFAEAVKGSRALQPHATELRLPARDAKFRAFLQVLRGVWAQERGAKVLVFTESRDTLEALRTELSRERIEALGYHGDLPLLERDRAVARFRDPEGPLVMLCTEVGGEGRNFQFAHHLVHYDLPWSPSTVEQRIGRLDRIGQNHPVEIHVFDPAGTLASDVLALLADAVGVFGETVGGLDAVLEDVESRLAELALLPREAREAYARELEARVEAARASVRRAYDPLLDLRSFDRAAVERLVARAQGRMGIEADDEEEQALEDGLWSVARDLDERLEEAVTELARRVGLGVDTDEQVDAFQCAFQFGHALTVEALPGVDVTEDRTVLGTFWRDTAVEAEELEYFATGHPLVEALFGFLRDGPYGRSGLRVLPAKRGAASARGLELLFHLQLPEPEDLSPGARVPSRQLARFLERTLIPVAVVDGAGGPKADAKLLRTLEAEGRALKGDEVHGAFPGFGAFVDVALPVAQRAAEGELAALQGRARTAIEAERDAALARMQLALSHQGLPAAEVEAQREAERAHYAALLTALASAKVTLDSACGFVLER
ncbi:helicase [Aggregicoccus sp. 17bor-14]|uniref:helicase-related protein n=1 Tax=Myxococcaceae TaxID=31 RepID=UPI00129C73ED|nr:MULTISPECIES: helicase-related protein [Myxococcaceae]MBF5043554.1 DEAD/DEAH box helicase family protein [Simulacricoccus sp. 17bor-14]MRI89314.1 helicase [Aggregicoccus sp. 17bor-14]